MGTTLSEPITEKTTLSQENANFKVVSCAMQGWRRSMEDTSIVNLNLSNSNYSVRGKKSAFFGVFDGHSGERAALFVAQNLTRYITGTSEYKNAQYSKALSKGFLDCDQALRKHKYMKGDTSGTTAITMLIKRTKIYIANAGDSRCIACTNEGQAEEWSQDHKPYLESECSRIVKAGGKVEIGRINGKLAVSRGFGDFHYKSDMYLKAEDQLVIATPDIKVKELSSEKYKFAILASDGIWDVMENGEVVDFVAEKLANFLKPEKICEELMDACIAKDEKSGRMLGIGMDNMTVILVCFLLDKSYNEFVQDMKEIVQSETFIKSKEEHEENKIKRMQEKLLGLHEDDIENGEKSIEATQPCTE